MTEKIKPAMIHMKLPDDLALKARAIAGVRPLREVIIEALREYWYPSSSLAEIVAPTTYDVFGSIPSESKNG